MAKIRRRVMNEGFERDIGRIRFREGWMVDILGFQAIGGNGGSVQQKGEYGGLEERVQEGFRT